MAKKIYKVLSGKEMVISILENLEIELDRSDLDTWAERLEVDVNNYTVHDTLKNAIKSAQEVMKRVIAKVKS